MRFDAFVLDEGNATLLRDGQRVELPPKAFDVLCELARQPGRLITKDTLLDTVWGHHQVSDSVLKTTIGQIRSALSDDARAPRLIETVSRRGYRFVPTLAAVDGPAPVLQAGAGFEPIRPRTVAPPASESVPQAAPLAAPPGLIGRRAALAALQAAWRDASAGRRRIVWVSGEAGIGKTTLIDGFTAALGTGARVIHGQCVEQIGSGEPYGPILDALAMLCRNEPDVVALLRAVAPTWLLQLPWLGDDDTRSALQRELTGATQGRMLRELAEWLERTTQARPLLLVTEDLHWSDHATIQLLDHLARRRQPARLLWLASCRPADVIASGHPFGSLRHELRLHGLGTELALDPFSEQEVGAFLDARLAPGERPPDDFIRRLHAHTDGLPLFVAAATAELLDARHQRQDDGGPRPNTAGTDTAGADTTGTDVMGTDATRTEAAGADAWSRLALTAAPASLTGVIDRAIDRLAPAQIAMLAVASLIGVEFRIRTVADAAGLEPAVVRDAVDDLVRGQQWLDARPPVGLRDGSLDEPCAFRHSLYRHVFQQRIGTARRVEIHRRILASLTEARAVGAAVSPAELASHAEAGLMPVEAVGHLAEAAQSALARLAPVEAVRHAEAGLALLERTDIPAGEIRDELELALSIRCGTAHRLLKGLGDPAARQALERASLLCDRLPPTVQRAWFHGGIGGAWFTLGDYPRARAHAERIATLAAAADNAALTVLASNLGGLAACFEGRLADGIAMFETGLAVATDNTDALAAIPAHLIDPVVSMHAHGACARVLAGDVEAARRHLDLADARSMAIDQPFARMQTAWCRCEVAAGIEDMAQLARVQPMLEELVTTHAIGHGHGPAQWFGALLMAWRGEPGALARLERGCDINGSLGIYTGSTAVRAYGAMIARMTGDPVAALAQTDAGLRLADRIGERFALPQLHVARAHALAALGHPLAERIAAFDAAVVAARQTGNRWGELLAREARMDDAELAQVRAAEDRTEIAALLGRIRGADDTPLVLRARAIVQRSAS